MFQTLLEADTLYENPGLQDHTHAQTYLRERAVPPMNGRPAYGNSLEIGFKAVVRKIIKDVFKLKVRGLVLKNFEAQTVHSCPREIRRRFGKFLDEILRQAEIKESSTGKFYFLLDRFHLEEIKEENVSFFTDDKTGTYEIDVYCKDVSMYKNNWLITVLEHNAYSWETITMMRHKVRTQRRPLTSFFTRVDVN